MKANLKHCEKHDEIKVLLHGGIRCVSCRKEYVKNRSKTTEYKASKKKYNSSLKGIEKNRAFAHLPEQIEKQRIRNSLPKVKEYKAIHAALPASKSRRNSYNRIYRLTPEAKSVRNAGRKKRRETDSLYKMTENVRRRIYGCFKANSFIKKNTIKLIGCDLKFLFSYIESLFKSGMTWQNQGKNGWQIDHIVPLCSAKTIEELEKLCHYTNLQPLWDSENSLKNDKMPSGISFRKMAKNES